MRVLFTFCLCVFIVLKDFDNVVPFNDIECFWSNLKDYNNIETVDLVTKRNEEFKAKHPDPVESVNFFGYLKHLNVVYNSVKLTKLDDLKLTILQCTTDAFIIFPLMVKSISNKPLIHSIHRGIIITEILKNIAMPTTAKINILPEIRKRIYDNVLSTRINLYEKRLHRMYSKTTAMNILQSYNFDSYLTIQLFVTSVYTNLYIEEFNKCWVTDSNLNEKLRYQEYLEHSLTKEQAVERIYNIYSSDDINLINLPIEKLFEEYLENDLFDTVSFDDYYAIQNFLTNDYWTTNLQIPNLWRMYSLAMYSLALRQYDAITSLKSIKKNFYCIGNSNSESIDDNGNFQFNQFIVCHSHRSRELLNLRNRNSSLRFKTIYIVNSLRLSFLFINLTNIDRTLNQYVILPETKFRIRSNVNKSGETIVVNVITMEPVQIARCQWISSVSNMASLYTQMAANYNPETDE